MFQILGPSSIYFTYKQNQLIEDGTGTLDQNLLMIFPSKLFIYSALTNAAPIYGGEQSIVSSARVTL